MIIPPSGKKKQSEFAKKPETSLGLEQTPAQSNRPAPSSQCQVPFVTRVGTGLPFLAVLVFLGPPPGGEVPALPRGSSREWTRCGSEEGEMPQVLHCSSVGKTDLFVPLFAY